MRTNDENAAFDKRHYITDDGSSVSIADMLRQKKGAWRVRFQKGEMPSRPQEIGLVFATLGRKLDTDLEPPHDQNANRCCC